jgi:hypothetical protein
MIWREAWQTARYPGGGRSSFLRAALLGGSLLALIPGAAARNRKLAVVAEGPGTITIITTAAVAVGASRTVRPKGCVDRATDVVPRVRYARLAAVYAARRRACVP